MKRTGRVLVGLLIVSACAMAATPNKAAMTMFQDALYQEQTAGDLDKAIELYQKVVTDAGEIEKLAAKATFQLGMCYLKKDDKDKAAEYFQKVVSDYPAQKELVANAQKQLEQMGITTASQGVCVINTVPDAFANDIDPGLDKITVTFNTVMMDESWSWTGGGDTYPQTTGKPYYDETQKICTLPVKLEPGKVYWIGINSPSHINFKTPNRTPAKRYAILFATKNTEGKPTSIPKDLLASAKKINATAKLAQTRMVRNVSAEELADIVEEAVATISTCAETDPKIKDAVDSLAGLDGKLVVTEVCKHLDSNTDTIRRAAIYILWQGGLPDISAAEAKLITLCSHQENLTRGMATLAISSIKTPASFEAIKKMADDSDGYARRCGVYALGLYGDAAAIPVVEKALQDEDSMVKANAQAAMTMLTKQAGSENQAADSKPTITQEMFNDIQPDGTIQFKNPQQVVNSGTEPITESRFINSDFVQLTAMTDSQGKPIPFTAAHEGNIYRYQVTFDPPVLPGQTLVYITEGTITGLIMPVAGTQDTYRYSMTHSPSTGQPTLRIETYLLPAGAEVLSTTPPDMQRSEKDGRIELKVEKVIPANGSLTTSFKYKLVQ